MVLTPRRVASWSIDACTTDGTCAWNGVAGLACLEEHVGVLRAAAQHRPIRVEASVAVGATALVSMSRTEVVGRGNLDRVELVTRAEPIEEVQERHSRREGRRVGHGREVGCLLHAARAQHREAGACGPP